MLIERLGADQPGCSAAVGVDGTVVWTGGRGLADLATGRKITADTVFDIGSVSKQFTATAILLLTHGGGLSIDDPVSEHLTGLPGWADRVSVAQLMHHTSGIPDFQELLVQRGYHFSQRTTQAQALHALAEVAALRFEPGGAYEYSNSNGAGIIILKDGVLDHDGAWGGFRTAFEISADRHTAVAVTCNTPTSARAEIKTDLRKIWV